MPGLWTMSMKLVMTQKLSSSIATAVCWQDTLIFHQSNFIRLNLWRRYTLLIFVVLEIDIQTNWVPIAYLVPAITRLSLKLSALMFHKVDWGCMCNYIVQCYYNNVRLASVQRYSGTWLHLQLIFYLMWRSVMFANDQVLAHHRDSVRSSPFITFIRIISVYLIYSYFADNQTTPVGFWRRYHFYISLNPNETREFAVPDLSGILSEAQVLK